MIASRNNLTLNPLQTYKTLRIDSAIGLTFDIFPIMPTRPHKLIYHFLDCVGESETADTSQYKK